MKSDIGEEIKRLRMEFRTFKEKIGGLKKKA